MSRQTRLTGAPVHLTALALLLPLTACDYFNTGFDETEAAIHYRARNPGPEPTLSAPATIRVMTYNVNYGGARLRFFWECNGDRYLMTEGEVDAHIDALAARILAESPDIVLLQEVDTWRSKRVAYVDEVQRILDRVGLNYGVYASQWKADFVPTDGLGPVDSGNVILSRWPITSAVRHALALQTNIDFVTRYFYLKRNVLETRIAIPGLGAVAVVDVHAEAFSDDGTRQRHLEAFKAILDGIDDAGIPVVGGGDLNTLPPGSDLRGGYPEDAACLGGMFKPDKYAGEEALLQPFFDRYTADSPANACFWDLAHGSLPTGGPAADTSRCTFVGDEHFPLNRKLDHLFTNETFTSSAVLQDAILLSDHVPVVVDWEVTP